MFKNKYIYFLPAILILSIILGKYLGEDTLGGAKADYLFHKKFFFLFLNDFKSTIINYGSNELFARNSPLFYIIFSFFLNLGISLKILEFCNFIVVLGLLIVFFKCLKIQYKNINFSDQIIFTSIILLSPTIRSLTIWPYPFIWALLFFLISIYFFLKFTHTKNKDYKFRYAILNIVFVAISGYITPNFSIFAIFYFINYFTYFKLTKKLFVLFILNLFLSISAFYYFFITDFYFLNYNVYEIDFSTKYNIFNKLIIISSLILFYFIPFINLKKNNFNLNLNSKRFFILLLLFLVSIVMFNFPDGAGGGIFYHLSYKIFDNPILLFIFFGIFLLVFDNCGFFQKNNLILLTCLFFFLMLNFQFTINILIL